MKKFTFLFTLLTISLSFGQSLPITNGGFESGDLSDWDGYGTAVVDGANVIGAGTTKNGTFAGRVNNFGAPGSASLARTFDVLPGEKYIVNFWFTNQFFYVSTNAKVRNYTGGTNGDFFEVTPIVADGGGNAANSENYQCTISDQNPSFEWKEAKFSFVAPAGVTKARFTYFSQQGAFKYIDDFSVVQDATASIADLEQFNFKSYPNPVKDVINLSAAKNIDKIEVYSLLGQQVENRILNSKSNQVNVSNLTNGIYLVKVFIDDAVGTFKFVKQ